ncbi:hypothetical protein [Rhizobium sp. LC145]|jgi:hypothetical protein|uniref:hypothetical protein n=1 Tax=Rhizobium sp. LC145 TaxID=1120688 RepID=UPI001137DB2E|nr:hypothetical protein [Rhizobium sp. LC145]TKT57332.1 hypothetical protein FDR95_13710 [Rhizobiaceae bacterium LC148]
MDIADTLETVPAVSVMIPTDRCSRLSSLVLRTTVIDCLERTEHNSSAAELPMLPLQSFVSHLSALPIWQSIELKIILYTNAPLGDDQFNQTSFAKKRGIKCQTLASTDVVS